MRWGIDLPTFQRGRGFMVRVGGLLESKVQRWRAVYVTKNGKEGLLILGQSFAQIHETYDEPWFDLLEEEERKDVKEIKLQKWFGAPDRGQWVDQRLLPIPNGGLAITISAKMRPLLSSPDEIRFSQINSD